MNIRRYLKMTATLEVMTGKDTDTRNCTYAPPVTIPCFIYGKRKRIATSAGSTIISTQTYITVDDVKVGDKLDGQVVQEVNLVNWFDGRTVSRECVCW